MEDWLNSIGLADHIPAYRDNRITADQLRELTDADLRELGLTIGDRLRFRASLAELGRDPVQEIGAAEQSAGSGSGTPATDWGAGAMLPADGLAR